MFRISEQSLSAVYETQQLDINRVTAEEAERIGLITRVVPNYLSSAEAAAFLDAQNRDLNRTLSELGLIK